MSTAYHIKLGPTFQPADAAPVQQGRSPHGRWRVGYRAGAAPLSQGASTPAALIMRQDADRLAFALTEGPAAALLAEQIAGHLWTTESANGSWPESLRDWLDDTSQWPDAPPGLTGFICGRIERGIPGGRIYLAWLGMNAVGLFNQADTPIELDTVIGPDEGWTRAHGPEPEGMALHAYRGSLFGLERLIVLTTAAQALFDDLPDMPNPELRRAFEDWAAESEQDLALFDLRLYPVLNEPNSLVVDYSWVTSDQVQLSWRPSPNATAYRVEEASSPAFHDASLLAELTDGRQSSYQLSPPTGEMRFYRVTPLNHGVAGESSEPVCPAPILLNAPVMTSVQWAADGGYALSWMPTPQATSYEVQSSFDPDFQGHDNQIVYRGELPETFLSHTTPPGQYYRVRAINPLYAPRMPSPWSDGVRAPIRLPAPVFMRVTQERLEWEPVRGAQFYVVRVTTRDESGADHTEEVTMRDTACVVAEQRAAYHVRAFRRAGDERTASEWSEGVTLSPKSAAAPGFSLARVSSLLWGIGIAAVLVGLALGWAGVEVFNNYTATGTPTRLPQMVMDVTHSAGTQHARNATSIVTTEEFILGQTATAALFTATPTSTATPNATLTVQAEFEARLTSTAGAFTATPTPIDPADLTATFDTAFAAGFAATQAIWTDTPTPTATLTPIDPADLTATFDAAFAAGFAATQALWTATPFPTLTPAPIDPADLTATFDAAFAAGFAATQAVWTDTPVPTATPTPIDPADLTATFDVAFAAEIAATQALWTATPTPTRTPTPDRTATARARDQANQTSTAAQWTATPTEDMPSTIEAGLIGTMTAWTATPTPTATLTATPTPDIIATVFAVILADAGLPDDRCYIFNLTGEVLPVYAGPDDTSEWVLPNVPNLAEVIRRETGPERPGVSQPVWLGVILPETEAALAPAAGWVMVPAGMSESLVYYGACQPLLTE